MAKQKNANIGMVPCAHCDGRQLAAVRRNATGKLYYDCIDHGRITPNTAGGQDWVLERATLWGEQSPPAGAPRWIAEQWQWGRAVSDGTARAPYNGEKAQSKKVEAPVDAPRNTGEHLPPPPPVKPESAEPPRKQGAGGFAWLPFGEGA